ncbi:MAG: hypothetical protein ACOYD4_03365 [Solirubrobacterales bacterium]
MTPAELPPDPGEGRLVAYLEGLREDPPQPDAELGRRVNRSARWQHAIRGPLEVIGHLSGALFDGIAAMLGAARRSDR